MNILPPANEVGAKLCFYTFPWFCSQGGLPQCILRYTPRKTPPSMTHTPTKTPGRPPRKTPPCHHCEQCMVGDTGNKQAVRILLKCILITLIYFVFSPTSVWIWDWAGILSSVNDIIEAKWDIIWQYLNIFTEIYLKASRSESLKMYFFPQGRYFYICYFIWSPKQCEAICGCSNLISRKRGHFLG